MSADALEKGWLGPVADGSAPWYWRWLQRMGSLRLALVTLVLVAAGVIWAVFREGSTTWPLLGPLSLAGVNLTAAIAVHPAFRRQPALLVFHLALLVIVCLAAIGRLTYLKGHMELSTGEEFAGRLAGYEAGPWHPWHIQDVRFRNDGFGIEYLPGRQRDHTRAEVSFPTNQGAWSKLIIGDQVPLVLRGYRFYTSFNKGFALTFRWHPRNGQPQRGTIHLPAYPIHEYRQANTWTPPGSLTPLWVQLQFDQPLLDPSGPSRFETPDSHKVVVRADGQRVELIPGQTLTLAEGRLLYEGVSTWMGYKVFYDRTLPWLLAAGLVAVASLGWHFWIQFAGRPWRIDHLEVEGAS